MTVYLLLAGRKLLIHSSNCQSSYIDFYSLQPTGPILASPVQMAGLDAINFPAPSAISANEIGIRWSDSPTRTHPVLNMLHISLLYRENIQVAYSMMKLLSRNTLVESRVRFASYGRTKTKNALFTQIRLLIYQFGLTNFKFIQNINK